MIRRSLTPPASLWVCVLAFAQVFAAIQAAPTGPAIALDELRSRTTVPQLESRTALAILRQLVVIDAGVFLRMNQQAKSILESLEQLTGSAGRSCFNITPTTSQHIGLMLLSAAFICSVALTFLVLCDCAYSRRQLLKERQKAEKEDWS